jgi:hypothetical protein
MRISEEEMRARESNMNIMALVTKERFMFIKYTEFAMCFADRRCLRFWLRLYLAI